MKTTFQCLEVNLFHKFHVFILRINNLVHSNSLKAILVLTFTLKLRISRREKISSQSIFCFFMKQTAIKRKHCCVPSAQQISSIRYNTQVYNPQKKVKHRISTQYIEYDLILDKFIPEEYSSICFASILFDNIL